MKKHEDRDIEDEKIREVMGLLGKRSAEARQKKWGKREFTRKMREYGKLGGRPRKIDNNERKETK